MVERLHPIRISDFVYLMPHFLLLALRRLTKNTQIASKDSGTVVRFSLEERADVSGVTDLHN